MIEKIKELIKGLNECERQRLIKEGFTNNAFFIEGVLTEEYTFKIIEKRKYFYINCGGSGVFMIDKAGEIFNIKGYGTADKNKKLKADLGNVKDYIFSDDNILDIHKIQILHSKRYNYLR